MKIFGDGKYFKIFVTKIALEKELSIKETLCLDVQWIRVWCKHLTMSSNYALQTLLSWVGLLCLNS